MSDRELRDKLANQVKPLGKLLSPYEQDLWSDGWDAARANPLRDEKRLWNENEALRKERDQLRAERNDYAQATLILKETIDFLKVKLEQSKIAAEKLAEALEFYSSKTKLDCGELATVRLAEYREKFPRNEK